MDRLSSKLIAFYLPQFHPVPENDEWWGPGFTEWTNVTRAKPLFRGHYQPQLPADLGFYDLRLPDTRIAQAELAGRYGIGAFCYYHYWFNGRRILERPFNEVLASGQPEFPFCLCWANEDWTRAWDGQSRQVLLQQVYSPEDDKRHFESLLPAFTDPRYLKKDGRPIFLVYRGRRLPDPQSTTRRWQELARAHGLPGLYLLRVESFPDENDDPRTLGFDAAVEFQPEWRALFERRWKRYRRKWLRKLGLTWPGSWRHNIQEYRDVVKLALSKPAAPYPRHPCVAPSWDNSARRFWDALILKNAEPSVYEEWLREVLVRDQSEFVFINAWNEWAEGCHLEPCSRWGHSYLEATRAALEAAELPLEGNAAVTGSSNAFAPVRSTH
jgi:lipopolysaccharide biosynthesis protein